MGLLVGKSRGKGKWIPEAGKLQLDGSYLPTPAWIWDHSGHREPLELCRSIVRTTRLEVYGLQDIL